ncbi:MAG: hypothetical protein R8G66_09810 [Cytophagales bacterium]|nr:hypothetical protein [Cytophagales bacterium]
MAQIRASDSYKILSKEEQLLQQFKVDAERTKAIEEGKIRTAKKMKKDGIDVETIKKYTGLRVGEIRKL